MSGAATTTAERRLPTADAGRDFVATFRDSFELDGSESRAAPGRTITDYIWRQLPPLS